MACTTMNTTHEVNPISKKLFLLQCAKMDFTAVPVWIHAGIVFTENHVINIPGSVTTDANLTSSLRYVKVR